MAALWRPEGQRARAWAVWAVTVALLAVTLVVALFFFRQSLARDCGFCDDAASSVSNAPA